MIKLQSVVRNTSKAHSTRYLLTILLVTAIFSFSNFQSAHSAQVTFAWDPSPSTVSGYRLYYGTASGTYSSSANAGTNTSYTLDLTASTQYVVAKAYDAGGNESAPSNEVVAHALTASAGTGGAISPTGTSYVSRGSSKTYSITPSVGYSVADVRVDNVSVGAVSTYTFSNVTAPHSISATFAANPITYTITSSAGANGSISPSGSVSVTAGSNQTFTITPSTGYKVASLTVDGATVSVANSYTFSNVTAAHSISATFTPITYTITSSAGSNGSISPAGSVTVNHGASQTFTITPSTGYKVASLTVDGATVSVANSYTFSNVTAAHSISATFAVNNQPPVANAGPDQTVAEGQTVTLIGANSTDPENGTLTYSWVQTGGTQVSLSSSSVSNPTFTTPNVGVAGESLTFKLTVTDSGGLKSEDSCIVNVTWVNSPPTANAGPQQSVTEGADVTLDGSESTDPDDGIATYEWKQTNGPAVTLIPTSPASVSFTAPAVESQGTSLTFELTVTDNGGLRSTATCIVNVTNNLPPVANAGADQTVYQGISVMLDGTASADPDGTIVSYRWVQTSGSPVTLSDPSAPKPLFTAPAVSLQSQTLSIQGEALNFSLTVTDDHGLQSVDTCAVYVNNNTGPDLTGLWQTFSYSGSTASGTFYCRNVGNAGASAFAVQFYLSNDGKTPGKLLKTTYFFKLDAAATKKISFKYTAAGLSGKYILAVVDSGNAVKETSETNNSIPVVIPAILTTTRLY